jgi:hypothetical protein
MSIKSNNLKHCYKDWVAQACPTQVAFVDEVYALCEKHYEEGGDRIVECWTPEEIVKQFRGIQKVKEYLGLMAEQALNTRWGEDNDPQLEQYRKAQEWLQ